MSSNIHSNLRSDPKRWTAYKSAIVEKGKRYRAKQLILRGLSSIQRDLAALKPSAE